jgi:ribosome-associated protein
MTMPDVPLDDYIRLDQFLKLQGVCGTGGQAKMMIQGGEVEVNGETELRRGRKLFAGDTVVIGEHQWIVPETTPRDHE